MEANHRSRLARRASRCPRSWMIDARSITQSVSLLGLAVLVTGSFVACSDAIHQDAAATIEARFTSGETVTGSVEHAGYGNARPRQDSPVYHPTTARDQTVIELAFPTGRVETSAVVLHQVSPRVVDLNQPFVLEYHVTNLTEATLDEVSVHLHEAQNLTLLDSSVHPMLDEDSVYWPLGRLGPGQTRVLRASARSNSVGPAETVATVTYRNVLRSQTQVVEPKLELRKTAPACCARDEVFELEYTLTNAGTGTARKITVTDDLPPGLVAINGLKRVTFPVLALGPGQTEVRRVRVRADRLGTFSSPAQAVGEPELLARSDAPRVEVLNPTLGLTVHQTATAADPRVGPGLASGPQTAEATASGLNEPEPLLNGQSIYRLRLRNTGRVAARAARVMVPLEGLRVVSTSRPAVVGESTLTMGYDVIEAGATVEFEVVVVREAHSARLVATATADHADPVRVVLSSITKSRVAALSRP